MRSVTKLMIELSEKARATLVPKKLREAMLESRSLTFCDHVVPLRTTR